MQFQEQLYPSAQITYYRTLVLPISQIGFSLHWVHSQEGYSLMLARWPPLAPGLHSISTTTPEKDFSKKPGLFSLTNHCGQGMGYTD